MALVFKAKPFKEDLHPRDRKGRFARKRLRRIAAALRGDNDTIPDDFYWGTTDRSGTKKSINAWLSDRLLLRAETDPKLAEALDHFAPPPSPGEARAAEILATIKPDHPDEDWSGVEAIAAAGEGRTKVAKKAVRSIIDGWANSAYKSPSSWLVQQRARKLFDVKGIEQDPRFMPEEERKKHWVGTMEDPESLDPQGQLPYPQVVADFLFSADLIDANKRKEMGWTDYPADEFTEALGDAFPVGSGHRPGFTVDQRTIDMREGNIAAAETILDAIVEQVYEDTQKMFKDKHIEAVELHRGTDSQYVRDASTPPLGIVDDPGSLHDIATAFHEWEVAWLAYDDALDAKSQQEGRNADQHSEVSATLRDVMNISLMQSLPVDQPEFTLSPEEDRAWRLEYDPEDRPAHAPALTEWLRDQLDEAIGSSQGVWGSSYHDTFRVWVKHALAGDKFNDFDHGSDDTPLPGLNDRFPYYIPREQRKLMYGTIERLFDGGRTPDGDLLKGRVQRLLDGHDEWDRLNVLYAKADYAESDARHHFEKVFNEPVPFRALETDGPTPGKLITENLRYANGGASLVPGEPYARERIKAFGEDLARATKIEIPDTTSVGFGAILQPLSSFSTDADATSTFGHLKLSATVPVERIWSTAITGPGCLGSELEMIIIGGETDLNVSGGDADVPPVSVETGLFETSWAAPELVKAAKPLALLDLYEPDWIKALGPDITWPYQDTLDKSFRHRDLLEKGDKVGHPFRGNQWRRVLIDSLGREITIQASKYDVDSKVLARLEEEHVDQLISPGPVEFPREPEHLWLTGSSNERIFTHQFGHRNLGILVQPETKGYLKSAAPGKWGPNNIGIDNGLYAAKDGFSLDKYLLMLEDIASKPYLRDKVLYANAPDYLEWPDGYGKGKTPRGNWEKTLERSARVLPVIRALGLPASIVLQDGATVDTVPWDKIDAVFVGGSNDFKHSSEVRAIAAEAHRRGMWVHVGRVNSWETKPGRANNANVARLSEVAAWADSSDGTYIGHGPDKNWPKVEPWLTTLRDQQMAPYDRDADLEKKAPKVDPEKYLAQEAMDAAIRYAEEHAGELITGKVRGKLSKSQQAAIRTNIKRAIARGEDIDKASARVKRLVGLSERDALAVDNYERYLRHRNTKDSTVQKAVKDYERRLHNRRARLIAGQEIAKAVAEGKREVWKAAQEEGTLSHKAHRVFHTHPDEKTCSVCRPLDGTRRKLDDPGGPPMHVQCRCWETLEDPNPLPAHRFQGNQYVRTSELVVLKDEASP